MAQVQDDCQKKVEDKFEKYKNFGDQVYQEYKRLYKLMCSKLNERHLEPFAKILMEHENIVLKGQKELVESVRQNLEKEIQQALHNLWESNTVSEALISLEICKEKFKSYEGHKWNLDAKTPWELTRAIRMRFKENRLRYLQAQLGFQNKQLEEVLQENEIIRQHLLNVKHQRTILMENIENFRKKIELSKSKIMELQLKMLEENYENVEANIETGK